MHHENTFSRKPNVQSTLKVGVEFSLALETVIGTLQSLTGTTGCQLQAALQDLNTV